VSPGTFARCGCYGPSRSVRGLGMVQETHSGRDIEQEPVCAIE
jgi:hypothetical protein